MMTATETIDAVADSFLDVDEKDAALMTRESARVLAAALLDKLVSFGWKAPMPLTITHVALVDIPPDPNFVVGSCLQFTPEGVDGICARCGAGRDAH